MPESTIVAGFKVLIIVMFFYSLGINIFVYTIPTPAQVYVTDFSNDDTTRFQTVSQELEQSLTRQTNIPVINVGALVYYSGNILIDLLLNFLYALPEMLGFLFHGLTLLFNLDPYLLVYIETFSVALMTALYIIGVIQLLAGVRSGRII